KLNNAGNNTYHAIRKPYLISYEEKTMELSHKMNTRFLKINDKKEKSFFHNV
ncbi:hypothetical protein NPIL_425331, partial [Nephila pilipes]